jgi:hypothetical protein
MRVAVLKVISLFVVLTIKAGWAAKSLADLQLQQTWVWVLAAALGGKAFQSFAENGPGQGGPRAQDAAPGGAVAPAPFKRDDKAGIQDAP